jgi:hypothetical protein
MKRMLLTVILCLFILPGLITAQGVTTAAFNGLVTDSDGNPIVGATVTALHTPTGTVYTAVSRQDGLYNIPAVRAGGPYTVTVSMDPFKTQELTGIALKLGEDRNLKFKLVLETIFEEITVIASNPVISESRTGASQNISQSIIENMPSVTRSLSDFTRMSPQALKSEESDGSFTAGGRNNRYNNIQIDGAQSNDLFGLGSGGTPGSQAEATLISLDAIQEFQVVIAPFDVRQGMFTGGGVNIITKSGANNLRGSAFFEGRNQKFVGKGPGDTAFAKFRDTVMGGSFSGPIIKNKLFYFLNVESGAKVTPQDYFVDGSGDPMDLTSTGKVTLAQVEQFASIMQNKYGYDVGTYGPVEQNRDRLNLFGRLDWNINNNQRLTLRTSYISSDSGGVLRNSTSSLTFGYGGVLYKTRSNSTVLQLDSLFGKNVSNQLILSYSHINDNPTYMGAAFPRVTVALPGFSFYAGSESNRHKNLLKQDIVELSDNLTIFKGKHTFVLGTHNEFFRFMNVYMANGFGSYTFRTLADLEAGKPSAFTYTYSLTNDPDAAAKFSVYQLGLHAQDEWKMTPNLKLTLGIRADVPIIPNKPLANPLVEAKFSDRGLKTDQVASGNVLWSPRLGFNWDLTGRQSTQVRGGLGVFSGRTPYVWISNQFSNTGMDLARYNLTTSGTNTLNFFVTDVNAQPKSGTAVQGTINLIDKNFTYPQVLRTSLGIDQQLPFGFTGTVEFIYSMNLKSVMFQDINIQENGKTAPLDGRPLWGTPSTGSSNNSGKGNYINKEFLDVILMTNTKKGYEWNLSFQLQREWGKGSSLNALYSYGVAYDVNSSTSSVAVSNWQFNPAGAAGPNADVLARAIFDPGHRVMVAFSQRFNFLKNASTILSMIYDGHSGSRYSSIYYNDYNGDGYNNDLIYVPSSPDQIILTKGTWAELDAYINGDPGLSKYRGQIVPRNASREKWYNGFDLKLSQQIPMPYGEGHRLEVSLTLKNVLNLIDKNQGVFRYINYDDAPLTYKGLDKTTGKPIFDFYGKTDPANLANADYRFLINQLLSRWQLLLGVNYRF